MLAIWSSRGILLLVYCCLVVQRQYPFDIVLLCVGTLLSQGKAASARDGGGCDQDGAVMDFVKYYKECVLRFAVRVVVMLALVVECQLHSVDWMELFSYILERSVFCLHDASRSRIGQLLNCAAPKGATSLSHQFGVQT